MSNEKLLSPPPYEEPRKYKAVHAAALAAMVGFLMYHVVRIFVAGENLADDSALKEFLDASGFRSPYISQMRSNDIYDFVSSMLSFVGLGLGIFGVLMTRSVFVECFVAMFIAVTSMDVLSQAYLCIYAFACPKWTYLAFHVIGSVAFALYVRFVRSDANFQISPDFQLEYAAL